jgi:PAS domain S-box-containing protein
MMITDLQQRITAVNREHTSITGYSEAEALSQSPRLLASGNYDNAFYAAMWHNLSASGHWQGERWNKRKNGEPYPGWLTISAVRDSDDITTLFAGVFADISSLKHAHANLDPSFVHGLPYDSNDVAIVALGRNMQLTVIAEGVGTTAQESFLAAGGGEQIQGFVINRALNADAFAQNFLRSRHSVGTPEKAPV